MEPFAGRRFAAVLFDLDGTLVDSTPAVERSWRRWASEQGLGPIDLHAFHGRPARATVLELLGEDRFAAGLDLIARLELEDLDGVTPLPGAAEALAALPPNRTAIATSCTLSLALARIRAAGIELPKVLVSADDVEHGKPAPDPYVKAASQLGVDPADCLVVEDAVMGLAAGRAAGCATLAVVSTTAREDLDADLVIDDLSGVRWVVDNSGVGVVRLA